MSRRAEDLAPGEFYYVYNRGVRRQPIFLRPSHYILFLRKLRAALVPHHARILSYCLMPNHYHLLVQLLSSELSEQMHSLGTAYARSINLAMNWTGSLFETRFKAKVVDEPEYLTHLSRYIHLNPVDAGLVRQAQDWEYSSYRDLIGVRSGTLCAKEVLLKEFRNAGAYRLFVESRARAAFDLTPYLFEE